MSAWSRASSPARARRCGGCGPRWRVDGRAVAAAHRRVLGAAGYAAVAGACAADGAHTADDRGRGRGDVVAPTSTRASEALALAVIAVLLVDPLAVLGAGFWLSFLGVAWLLWCLPACATQAVARGWKATFSAAQGVATLGLVAAERRAVRTGLAGRAAWPTWWRCRGGAWSWCRWRCSAPGSRPLHAGAGGWAWQAAAWCFDLSWPLFERLAAAIWRCGGCPSRAGSRCRWPCWARSGCCCRVACRASRWRCCCGCRCCGRDRGLPAQGEVELR